ncbi:MAG: TonB-dependent receptor [Rhodospirillaceae bacterium]
MLSKNIFATLTSAVALTAFAGETLAQNLALEEIVVTARKRAESIQDIPLSVTAFSANQLKNQAITDVEDIIQFIPGVQMSNHTANRNNPAIRFRGIDPPSSERNKQTSSAFVDGVYLPGTSQWLSMNDIERVEVVKGPQSAFFGRATFGGAINFISKTPGNDWGGEVSTILGNHGRSDTWLSMEGPIIEDKLFIRASGRYYTYDGAWKNEHPSGGDLGAQQTTAGGITLYATPTEDISIKLHHITTVDDDGLAVQFLAKGESNNCGPFGTGTATYYCGSLSRDLVTNGISIDTSPLEDTSIKSDLGLDRDTNFTSLNIEWDLGGSGYTLSSITGKYTESTEELRELLSDEILVYLKWRDESFSQELRLASPDEDRLRWMIGAYYLDVTYNKDGVSGFPCPGNGPFCLGSGRGGPGLFGVNPGVTDEVENKALFGSLAYDITEKLTVSAEFRYEEETLANGGALIQEAMPTDPNDPIGTRQQFGGASIDVEGKFKAELPRVIVDYKMNDDTLLYASYAKGNNPGGFNPEVIQMEPTVAFPAFFAAEGIGYLVEQASLDAYEIGAKYSFPDGRGTLNGAIYYMEWGNQRFRGFTRNVDSNGDGVFILGSDRLGGQIDYDSNGSTDIKGFELASNYALTDNWLVSATYNYLDTDIKVYQDAVNARVFGDADASGFKVPRSPKHSATFAVDFNMPADNLGSGDGEWFARWDAWYQSSTYTWTVNLAKTESAVLHNLRGGWRNDRYSVTAWVENATNDDSVLAAQRTTGSFLTGTLGFQFTLPEPRTFGVTLSANF